MKTVGVIGAGAWGTALAQTTASNGHKVVMWAFETELVDAINQTHENTTYLPGVPLSPAITATSQITQMAECDMALAVTPAQHTRAILSKLSAHLPAGFPIILCCKGFERGTLALMTEVLADTLPDAIPAVLSGPSFAIDVARGLPTAVTLACADAQIGHAIMQTIGSETFRPYLASDLIGAEIGGAVKNVLAIAAGIVEGKQLGKSAHAALIARGYAEMVRLAEAMGAQKDTLTGLCGLGDLLLTCSSPQSRNMSCGLALGRGESLDAILSARNAVTEGVATAPALIELARRHDVIMPVCEAVNAILSGALSVDQAIDALLSRPFSTEE